MAEKALVVDAAEKAVGVASMVIASNAPAPPLVNGMPLPPPKPPPRGACWLLAPAAALVTGALVYPFLGRAPCGAPSKPIAPATASSTTAYSSSSHVASRPPARTIASRTDVVVAASSVSFVRLDMAHVLIRTLSCTSSCMTRAASSRTSTRPLLALASSASSFSLSPATASLRSRMAMLDASSSATTCSSFTWGLEAGAVLGAISSAAPSAPSGAFTAGAFTAGASTAGTTTRAVATSTSMAPTTAPNVHSLVARGWRPPWRPSLSVEAGRMVDAVWWSALPLAPCPSLASSRAPTTAPASTSAAPHSAWRHPRQVRTARSPRREADWGRNCVSNACLTRRRKSARDSAGSPAAPAAEQSELKTPSAPLSSLSVSPRSIGVANDETNGPPGTARASPGTALGVAIDETNGPAAKGPPGTARRMASPGTARRTANGPPGTARASPGTARASPGTARASWSASSHVAAPRARISRACVGVLTRRSERIRARSMHSLERPSQREVASFGSAGAVLGAVGAGRCSSRSAVAVASSHSAGSVHPSSTPSALVACTRSSRRSSSGEALVPEAALIRYTRATSDAQHGASARRGACGRGPRPMAA
eukprot:jgi/Chrpa1/2901/Chrysochromulina_OHIO_Genome00010043-RA